jgi:hypothetical protein
MNTSPAMITSGNNFSISRFISTFLLLNLI